MGVTELEPGLRLIRAPNPSPMTEAGTNTYLLGSRDLVLIDPGPDIDAHLEAILAAIGTGQALRAILVTHSHLDHSALAARLGAATGAPVLAYGDSQAGRNPDLAGLADIGGGEGVDASFAPDARIAHGERLELGDTQLRAHWTPGHFCNHMCFEWQGVIFTGDLVMGWASSLVSPPDGDLTAFMASLEHLRTLPARRYFAGHGAPIDAPRERLDWLWTHRKSREAEILAELSQGPATVASLTARIYSDIPNRMHPAAARNVLAHLIDLHTRNEVDCDGPIRLEAEFSRR